MVGEQPRLLYLPIASRPKGDGWIGHTAWLRGIFEPLGVSSISVWGDLSTHHPEELQEYEGIYIGGGNTFKLLHLLREHSFDAALQRYALSGGAMYGGSAGAILMGSDILSCERDDANEVDLQNTSGLDLLNGRDVWCHYIVSQHQQVQGYANSQQRQVYALPERGGLLVRDGQIEFAGFEPGTLVQPVTHPNN